MSHCKAIAYLALSCIHPISSTLPYNHCANYCISISISVSVSCFNTQAAIDDHYAQFKSSSYTPDEDTDEQDRKVYEFGELVELENLITLDAELHVRRQTYRLGVHICIRWKRIPSRSGG